MTAASSGIGLLQTAPAIEALIARTISTIGPVAAGSWRGPAARRYVNAVQSLESIRSSIVGGLEGLPSMIEHLGMAVEEAGRNARRWDDLIATADAHVAVARAAGDPIVVLTAEQELAHLRRSAHDSIGRHDLLVDRMDRKVASVIDVALVGLSVGGVAGQIVSDLEPVMPSDPLAAELESLAVEARTAMAFHALGSLTDRIRHLEDVAEYLRRWGLGEVAFPLLGQLKAHRQRLLEWSRSGRNFLGYDSANGSRVIEVFGDLRTAEHIAVLVPGITNSEYNYDEHLEAAARSLQSGDPAVAVIAWLGYDTPGAGPTGTGVLTLAAVDDDYARAGAEELAEFVGWLSERRGDAHISLVAHSYGSVVAAIAGAERQLAVDELVLVGSPGVPVGNISELHLNPGARVWAGLAPWDPIDELAWLAGFGGGLIHGTNPTTRDFGAIDLSFEHVAGHSGYFDPAGIAVLASVIAGTWPPNRDDDRRRSGGGAW